MGHHSEIKINIISNTKWEIVFVFFLISLK